MPLAARFQALRQRHQGYSGARPDVIRLLPTQVRALLDVGCGAGITGAMTKERHPHVRLVGVEPDPTLATLAEEHFYKVLCSSIEASDAISAVAEHGPFDVIICADVLEHLVDPGAVLAQLAHLLAVDGVIITSIPNVRHISTFVDLGLLGTWPARDRGIHDRTHLHFYARKDIIAFGEAAGLQMKTERRNLRLMESVPATKVPAALLDFWPLRPFLTFQYLHVWTNRELARSQA